MWSFVRILITVGAFWLLLRVVSLRDLLEAARRVPLAALAMCLVAVFIGQLGSVARFQLLLETYGADRKLPFRESLRLFLIATFYNTYLPGGVAGDVVRAVAIRSRFSSGGLTRALAISFVERVSGFSGLLLLTACVALIHPLPIPGLLPFSVLGLLATVAAVLGLLIGRKLARYMPARIGVLAAELPTIERPSALLMAIGCAVFTHGCTAIGFHAIIRSLSQSASIAESLVIVPIACSAVYLPATVAGAGTRDAAFVYLYERVGVPPADSLAMSLAALLCTLLVAAIGGVVTLVKPLGSEADA